MCLPESRGFLGGARLAQAFLMDQLGARIEQEGKVWFVVVAQVTGNPLKFQCESERDAKHFMKIFLPRIIRKAA